MTNPKITTLLREAEGLTPEERLEFASILIKQAKSSRHSGTGVDINKYSGTVHWPIDPLEYQRQVRAEWDR